MQNNRLNVVLDAFWGSSGKGKVCDWLTATRDITDLIAGNMPNAGHTVVRGDRKRVLKVLPSGAPFNTSPDIWLSGSSGFYADRLVEEMKWIEPGQRIRISDRAFTVTDEHAATERGELNHIASTMQGSATAMVEKIMRRKEQTIHGVIDSINGTVIPAAKWRQSLMANVCGDNRRALYEVAQGWGLSIDHGTHYPQCTSRNCSTQRALDDSAVPPQLIGDVIAVIRPYPIRVGNTSGGFSGGWAEDCTEVDWDHVRKMSGLVDDSLEEKERTTVTKRVRRVSTFSFELLQDCVIHNGVTGIFLNFAQYIDATIAGKRRYEDVTRSVRIFVDAIESKTNVKVIALGTGADTFDVIEI